MRAEFDEVIMRLEGRAPCRPNPSNNKKKQNLRRMHAINWSIYMCLLRELTFDEQNDEQHRL